MTAPVGIGIVGCGGVVEELHLPALERVPEATVVALADSERPSLAGRPVGYRDAAGLVADPDVELVAVCTPPAEHAGPALAALEAGKHLFVEKPLALDAAEARSLARAASGAGVVAATGFNLRCHRLVRAAAERLATGGLGELQAVRASWTSGRRLAAVSPWRLSRASGGGVLWDMAIHHADLWAHLTGEEVRDVFAQVRAEDEAAIVSARTPSGVLLETTVAQATSDSHELELVGTRGRLRLSLYRGDGLHWEPVGRLGGGPGARLRELGGSLRDLPRQAGAARRGGDYRDSFREQWRELALAVRGQGAPPADLQDGARAVAVVAAACESADTGMPAEVEMPVA